MYIYIENCLIIWEYVYLHTSWLSNEITLLLEKNYNIVVVV